MSKALWKCTSLSLVLIIAGLAGWLAWLVHPLLLILVPFALGLYISLGWSLVSQKSSGSLRDLPLRSLIPLLVFFGPAWFIVYLWRRQA